MKSTSPDITLASLNLLPYTSWHTHTTLGSDHLPIIVTLVIDLQRTPSDNRTFTNFKKADWQKFTEDTEIEFSKQETPPDIYKGEKIFREILNKAAKNSIPSGRIKNVYPQVPTEAANKIRERDSLRKTDPTAPDIERLNKEINKEINDYKRDKWRETITNVNRKLDSSKLFKLIKALNGAPKANSNQAIKFKGKYSSSPKDIANKFNQQFSSVVRHKSTRTNRSITKQIKRNSLQNPTKYTTEMTKKAIKNCKASKALGPDGLSNLHLKHLGEAGLTYLTDLFNLSTSTGSIPAIWKTSIIIPLLKPGKPSEVSTSYRPVSLLCPAIKILERLILPTLTEHLPIPPHQHGFRKHHSTTTALNDLNQDIADGFNKKKPPDRTILLQIDLSKAFDMVSHEKLLRDLNMTSLPGHLKRWFGAYLHGRQSKVSFRNATSSTRNVKTGVPQGAVTSPVLFNFYLTLLPPPPEGVFTIQYADDISVYTSGTNTAAMSEAINAYIKLVLAYLAERELEVSPSKSSVTLFTPDTKEALIHPQVKMDNKVVALERHPKLLGVTFDTMFSYSSHVKGLVAKSKAKINAIKTLAGTTWGQDKDTLIMTYKATCRSVLEYAAPVWTPIISNTSWEKLQNIQNQALRVATGCLKMSAVDHLHRETKVLPLRPHCELLTKQYLAATYQSFHPGNRHTEKAEPPRKLKPTLLQHREEVNNHRRGGLYKDTIRSLHTAAVKSVLNSYPPNKVLNTPPPEISKEEESLPRATRTTLARLRSGYCRTLYSYLSRIEEDHYEDKCPKCSITPHDTPHLFNCPRDPTDLDPTSLWLHPREAAKFLNMEVGDEDEDMDIKDDNDDKKMIERRAK